ncbi:MAG TPA: hypothetical protein V6C71_15840 [Coleofasciculaceae cyanobacterium]|jgi:hypothetical protein
MTKYRVYQQRIVSPDGRAVAEATSTVITSGDNQTKVEQSVSVNVTQNGSFSSNSSSSTSSSHTRAN